MGKKKRCSSENSQGGKNGKSWLLMVDVVPPHPFNFEDLVNWPTWLKDYKMFHSAVGLEAESEEQQINMFLTCMGPATAVLLDSMDSMEKKSFTTVVAFFEEYFSQELSKQLQCQKDSVDEGELPIKEGDDNLCFRKESTLQDCPKFGDQLYRWDGFESEYKSNWWVKNPLKLEGSAESVQNYIPPDQFTNRQSIFTCSEIYKPEATSTHQTMSCDNYNFTYSGYKTRNSLRKMCQQAVKYQAEY